MNSSKDQYVNSHDSLVHNLYNMGFNKDENSEVISFDTAMNDNLSDVYFYITFVA